MTARREQCSPGRCFVLLGRSMLVPLHYSLFTKPPPPAPADLGMPALRIIHAGSFPQKRQMFPTRAFCIDELRINRYNGDITKMRGADTMKKRLFSLILAFALLLSAVPTVFAATHHEVVIDGVVYWVYPEEGYAEIRNTVKGSLPQVLEIPQYVNGYPVTSLYTFGLVDLEGVVGVILPDTMTFIDDISIAGFDLVFVSLPNNEVNIEKNFVGAHALDYYYLPQNFSLSPECSAYGSKLFASHTCVGYEKHRAFARDLIPMDAHPDSQYVPANSGVFRVDGNELTAIYLVSLRDPSFNGNLFVMDSAVNGMPITKVEGTCKNYNTSLVLGDYVRVVEDGAFTEEWGQIINDLYTPACLERLPANLPVKSGITTVYGTTGTYAEQYAKENGLEFLDMAKTPFVDVPENEWYFPYVHDVYWLGLMNGTSETTFEPLATTSRAMVVQVLYNMSDRPRVYAQKAFDDVVEGQWYYDAVNWAKAVGVCNGTSETEFSPNDPVTREQLAAFLYRYAVLCGYTCIASGDLSGFSDRNRISDYAREPIQWAVGAGIINGTSPTTLEPRSNATRAEIATMLCRLVDFLTNN
ncbi:MAG TPA: hypothetical protein DIW49_04705 [Clostridiales bacterium]|nr:hypothetical protein [Clostridiales bacterium]